MLSMCYHLCCVYGFRCICLNRPITRRALNLGAGGTHSSRDTCSLRCELGKHAIHEGSLCAFHTGS